MFKSLFTPIKARFEQNSKSPPLPPLPLSAASFASRARSESPEDFERDERIQVMRQSVEDVKVIDGVQERLKLLTEIHRVMAEESTTKDVFRELDGFLIMMSLLSALHSDEVAAGNAQDLVERMEVARLALAITSLGMTDHPHNKDYFESRVGFDALTQAISPFTSDSRTLDQAFGFLLCLALADFSLAGIFQPLRSAVSQENGLAQFERRLGVIWIPQAIIAMAALLGTIPQTDDILPYCVFKVIERLASFNHRNQASLNALGLGGLLFERLYVTGDSHAISSQTKTVMQKLLRKMLGIGAPTKDVRLMFKKAVPEDGALESHIVEVLRMSMRVKWPEHFSLDGVAAIELKEDAGKGMPCPQGFSFMSWISIDDLPKTGAHILFGVRTVQRFLLKLSIRADGKLELWTNVVRDPAVLEQSLVHKGRWTHLSFIHYPAKSSPPSIRIFIDGALTDTLTWSYPKLDSQPTTYTLGDIYTPTNLTWNLASACLLSTPLSDDIPRLVHHLGPRYNSHLQDPVLTRFLTYTASTSLNIYFFSLASARATNESSPLIKAIKSGVGVSEDHFVFALSPAGTEVRTIDGGRKMSFVKNAIPGKSEEAEIRSDVITYRPQCLDVGVWEIGGSAVLLRIIELANNPHDLHNTVAIFADALRTSWQNSEDVERIRGYEILAGILRAKSQLINMATFEVLFEFLGLDFSTPESSTIVNSIAYRFIALDFEIWSRSRKEVQLAHLGHFVTLLETSRYKRFNFKQRIAKFGLVRKLLFVLQTTMYQHDVIPSLVDALRATAMQNFSVDESIKPLLAYLAANLHESESSSNASPRSLMSRIDRDHAREKAEQALECLTSILWSPGKLDKFMASLPLSRICLLLLGDHPTPVVASQILLIVGLILSRSSAFNRKFELVSGWTVLRSVLPGAWDPSVHVAVFDVLLGRIGSNVHHSPRAFGPPKVACPYILPAIITSLDRGLTDVVNDGGLTFSEARQGMAIDSAMEVLVEELIDLHSSSPSFRELFKSQQTTGLLVDACKPFVTKVAGDNGARTRLVRLLEKITHLVLMLALDIHVDAIHKQELLAIIRVAEESSHDGKAYDPIDASLLTLNGSMTHRRKRSSTATRRTLQVLGDRTYQKSLARIREWQKTIAAAERKRLRKLFQDLQEHHRQAERLTQWRTSLVMEPGLWSSSVDRKWRLDETEGPFRIRKKLEPEQVKILSVKVNEEVSRNIEEPDLDAQSVVQADLPPWAEAYELSATGVEEGQELAEEVGEDKHRRVRHELEPGDVIEAVKTATRIIGVDSSPGLLILGKTHLYMLDGLVEGQDGEVIEVKDAPKNLFSVPGSMVELDGIQRAQRWSYDQIAGFSKRTCLFRDVALEIYFRDTRSMLVVFASKQDRHVIHTQLMVFQSASNDLLTPGIMRTPLLSKVSARLFAGFRDEISTAQRRWQAREISNFTYLSIINQTSGRTPSDATQYPIYPWVLQDYSSQELDLTVPETYRDLRRPMGALSSDREEAANARYTSLQAIDEKPFHYGTHFSSSMITCHFMMRLEPFAHMFKRLQGGDWDLPDRLFTDIQRAYKSASEDSRGDVRELIPEFYTCPEFLVNSSNIDFGVQNSGEKIHDVKLPPWAKGDPLLFITLHRRALESDHVSEHLPDWIDLIWGYKQRDPESFNVFHPLSYEGTVDLDSISDEVEREASVGIIHNFGQTPRKLFSTPHPKRLMHGITTLPLGNLHGIEEDHQLLAQSSKPTRNLKAPVSFLCIDPYSERMLPCRENMMYVPSHPHEYIAWGFLDQSLRFYSDRKLVQCYESSFCSCASFPDSETLVTGSHDSKVRLWRLTHLDHPNLSLLYILTGHHERVLCVVTSRAWSLVVSGSADGCAMLWELNRAQYVRAIEHGSPVHLAAINESTGYIATCSREKLCLHTINAHQIATLDISGGSVDQKIMSLAFHEREWSRLGVLATGTTGGLITLRTWNADNTPEDDKACWEFQTLRTLTCRQGDGGAVSSVTALKFVGECLFFGQEDGKVYSWDLPD
ncbi:beach-domain-containing protein [Ramaria rubella]|nr:beach-domain-containing protein [Ramaria rubella]